MTRCKVVPSLTGSVVLGPTELPMLLSYNHCTMPVYGTSNKPPDGIGSYLGCCRRKALTQHFRAPQNVYIYIYTYTHPNRPGHVEAFFQPRDSVDFWKTQGHGVPKEMHHAVQGVWDHCFGIIASSLFALLSRRLLYSIWGFRKIRVPFRGSP